MVSCTQTICIKCIIYKTGLYAMHSTFCKQSHKAMPYILHAKITIRQEYNVQYLILFLAI